MTTFRQHTASRERAGAATAPARPSPVRAAAGRHDSSRARAALVVFGVAAVVCTSLLLLTALVQLGVLDFNGFQPLVDFYAAIYLRLGSSVLFFAPVVGAWAWAVVLLRRELDRRRTGDEARCRIELLDLGSDRAAVLCMTIGVLYTAWGTLTALGAALGGVTAADAAETGAWGILSRLVAGGLLLSLWTTVVGGALGSALRLGKAALLARPLQAWYLAVAREERREVLDQLEAIAALLGNVLGGRPGAA